MPAADASIIQDPKRLAILHELGLLDSPAEEAFDRLTRLASLVVHAPVSLVSLIDKDRQFFKSFVGLGDPWASQRQTPLSHSFCQHVVASGEPLIIEDARLNPLVQDNLAIPDLDVIGYLGMPLTTSTGAELGSFCVIDSKPRIWTEDEINIVRELAKSVMLEIELKIELAARKRTQQELTVANESLAQRTQELEVANRMVKEASRLKSEFLSTMSHELRTPLNAMLGFSSILLEGMGGEVDDDARHMISRISANSERLLKLINGLLDIAKIEAGRIEIIESPVNLRKLVKGWHEQMGVLAEQKHLVFEIEVDPSLPLIIKTDSERLSQIAINLLSNAFKFTTLGSVKLSLKPLTAENQLQIDVTDSGIGIPAQALNYIFEEFRQLDGSNRRAYGGTGLGLAIARNLCRVMGGNIRVHSELGVGSTFTVTLPLIPVQDAACVLEGSLT